MCPRWMKWKWLWTKESFKVGIRIKAIEEEVKPGHAWKGERRGQRTGGFSLPFLVCFYLPLPLFPPAFSFYVSFLRGLFKIAFRLSWLCSWWMVIGSWRGLSNVLAIGWDVGQFRILHGQLSWLSVNRGVLIRFSQQLCPISEAKRRIYSSVPGEMWGKFKHRVGIQACLVWLLLRSMLTDNLICKWEYIHSVQ